MLNLRRSKGFTLAELLIVIAIIAILVAIAIPLFNHYLKKAEIETCAYNRALMVRQLIYEQSSGAKNTNDLRDIMRTIDIKCPTGIEYKPEKLSQGKPEEFYKLSLQCTLPEHEGEGSHTIPNALLVKFAAIYAEMEAADPDRNRNDLVRQEVFKRNGNQWPTLDVDGKTLYIQPLYDDSTGEFTIFANSNDTPKGDWFTGYIYDTDKRTWMTGKPFTVLNLTTEQIAEKMEAEGWKPAKGCAEGNLNL